MKSSKNRIINLTLPEASSNKCRLLCQKELAKKKLLNDILQLPKPENSLIEELGRKHLLNDLLTPEKEFSESLQKKCRNLVVPKKKKRISGVYWISGVIAACFACAFIFLFINSNFENRKITQQHIAKREGIPKFLVMNTKGIELYHTITNTDDYKLDIQSVKTSDCRVLSDSQNRGNRNEEYMSSFAIVHSEKGVISPPNISDSELLRTNIKNETLWIVGYPGFKRTVLLANTHSYPK